MRHLINRIFRLERLNGGERCPDYMHRWTLFKTRWFSCYLHHFIRDDWSKDFHDHPKHFVSIGLKGRYIEVTPRRDGDGVWMERGAGMPWCTIYRAPWIRHFPPQHAHRILLFSGETCWTLVFVGRPKREWGFWLRAVGVFIPWRNYVDGPHGTAGKNCE